MAEAELFEKDLRSFFERLCRIARRSRNSLGDLRGVGLAVAIVVFFGGGEMFVGGFAEELAARQEKRSGGVSFRRARTEWSAFPARRARRRNVFPKGLRGRFEAGGAGHGPFCERQHSGANDWSDGTLGASVEFAYGFDGVAE